MANDSIIHLALIKMRAVSQVGNSTMSLQLRTFDELNQVNLVPFTLTPTNNKVLQRLCNYMFQGIILRGAAVNINDTCRVQDIVLFVKSVYEEYPG